MKHLPARAALDGLRVVVDGAHGAAYKVAPLVFELGAEVSAIGVKPNGKNINDRHGAAPREPPPRSCDERPTWASPSTRRRPADRGRRARAGIDGDAIIEHLRAADAGGTRAPPPWRRVMSNPGPGASAAVAGPSPRAHRGRRPLRGRRDAREVGMAFGGEQSALVFLDHATTGDGLIAALQVVAALVLPRGR
ncbi:MAG: hypothetical protein R3A48_07185 [Polyangiales bacterium]